LASFNKVILVGNVTRDPELQYTPNGTAVTELGLAINDKYKDKQGEWVESVTFVDVTMWQRQAEVASEYLKKGSPVLIEGRLQLDSWEQDGQKRSKLKVVGDRMQMLGSKGESHQQNTQEPEQSRPQPGQSYAETSDQPSGDVPF